MIGRRVKGNQEQEKEGRWPAIVLQYGRTAFIVVPEFCSKHQQISCKHSHVHQNVAVDRIPVHHFEYSVIRRGRREFDSTLAAVIKKEMYLSPKKGMKATENHPELFSVQLKERVIPSPNP